MIIFLYGPNSYLRLKKLNNIIGTYKEKNKESFIPRFDFAEERSEDAFFDFFSSVSIFEKKKAAILENIFESDRKKEIKKILQDVLNDKENVFIIMTEVKPPSSFSFLLDKPAFSQEFPEIKEVKEIESFVRAEALEKEVDLGEEQVSSIASLFGKDLWGISTELDSLQLFPQKEIGASSAYEYFKLLNTLKFGKSEKEKLISLELLLSSRNDDPARIFNGLAFGANKKEFIDLLADYDVMVKSGKLEYEEALLDLSLR